MTSHVGAGEMRNNKQPVPMICNCNHLASNECSRISTTNKKYAPDHVFHVHAALFAEMLDADYGNKVGNIEIEVWFCSIIWTESKNLAFHSSSYTHIGAVLAAAIG